MNMSSYNSCLSDKSGRREINRLASLLKLVSEESRLKILCMLKKREQCVCEIVGYLGLSQSLISHHLADLRKAQIIVDEKRGQRVYYSLTKKGKEITNLLFEIRRKEEGE